VVRSIDSTQCGAPLQPGPLAPRPPHDLATAFLPSMLEAGAVGFMAPDTVRFAIHNMNLRGGLWPKQGGQTLAARMRCHVETFNRTLREQGLDWDLVAINEGAVSLPCYLNGRTQSSAQCLAEGIRGTRQVWTHQNDEYGLIVNTDKFEVIGGPLVRTIGDKGTAKRKVLAVHLRVRRNGQRFLFASTHINTHATNYCWRVGQVRDLIAALREWRRADEGQPIVAGDFNCTAAGWNGATDDCGGTGWMEAESLSDADNDAKLCAWLGKRFAEAAEFAHIEHVSRWVRGQGVPPGKFVRHEMLEQFRTSNCSDHRVAYAEVMTPCQRTCGECGSDGCGGQCGRCPDGFECQRGKCAARVCAPGLKCCETGRDGGCTKCRAFCP
jgi:hypothetical protein